MTASKTPFAPPKPTPIASKTIRQADQDTELPISGGRQSYPEGINTIGAFIAELSFIEPDFPIKMLEALEQLAKYHGDVSLAVENIVSLGNTDYVIEFDDQVKDNQAKEMRARIILKEKQWYVYSGGLYSLINDLLAQCAIFGCLSAEQIPDNSLTGIKKVAFVTPKHIRFKYNKEADMYEPYQHVPNGLAASADVAGLIKLNTVTYKYQTLRRFSEKPYPIPPFLSAIFHINIERDMMDNLRHVIKKLGVLGFLEVLINAPKPATNEDPKLYAQRSRVYLDEIVPEIEKGMSKGYVTGFEGRHKFNMHSTATSVQGTKELVDLNDQKMMAGLKQDPLMFGRNFSTTETLGRVILAKMTSQIANYQNLVATFLGDLFLLDLQLAGYKVKSVIVKFEKAMIGDRLKDAQAFAAQIANADSLYNNGTIGQQQRANLLGYEKPDQKEPRIVAPALGANPAEDGKDPSPKKDDATDPKTTDKNFKPSLEEFLNAFESLGGNAKQYEYISPACNCEGHDHVLSYGKLGDTIQKYVDQYLGATKLRYSKAVKSLTNAVGEKLLGLGEGAGEQEITDAILYTLYTRFKGEFTDKMQTTISKFVSDAYTFFRKDKTVFGTVTETGKAVPNGAFNTIDYRALEYFKNSDSFYLGKFITDDDLKSQITQYIQDEYLTRNLPIGNNTKALSAFKEKFGDIMEGQDWKLRRIIDTTVSKMRNTAAVNYMNQAEVESFEVVGVTDRLQCAYCKNMQGKTFSVSRAVNSINNLVKSEPELVGMDSPFITAIYKKPDDMKELTGDQLQDAGVTTPPFHSHCRDVLVAIL